MRFGAMYSPIVLKHLQTGYIPAKIKTMTTKEPSPNLSPKWSSNTKLIVGLTMVAIVAILIRQLQNIIGPLILAFVLAFLLHPLAGLLNNKLKFSWRLSVGFVLLLLVIVLAGIFTLTGFAVVQQIQSLIATIQQFIAELPRIIADLSSQTYSFGPFELDLGRFDLTNAANQLLSSAQAMLGQVGSLVGTIATGTISTLSYVFFILLITYFLLAEGGQVREDLLRVNLPGYDADSSPPDAGFIPHLGRLPAQPAPDYYPGHCYLLYSVDHPGNAFHVWPGADGRPGSFCPLCGPFHRLDNGGLAGLLPAWQLFQPATVGLYATGNRIMCAG